MTRNTLQLNALVAILLLLGSLVFLNLLSWEYLGTSRADLTDAQRWRIADVTRDVLAEMQKRHDDLVAAAGPSITEEERDALRLRVDFYVSAEPPPTVVDRFLEAGDRLRDIEELAGDFFVLRRKDLIPGKTVSEIEEAEEYDLAKISELDELGKPLDLYCGLVVHWGEETKVLHNAMPPVDVESWLVRTMSTFIDTEPAKVWVLAPYELQSARLTRDGQAQLRGFVEDLRDWVQSQNISDMQEVQRLATTYRPKVLRSDLRRLFPRAAIVKMVTRIEQYDPIPDDCSLLVLMQPNADVMSEEAMRQISRYLANGGTVVALAPRYEVGSGQQAQQQLVGKTVDLGEFGNYLESLGVTVRPEVVAQLPCYTMSDESQVAQRGNTAGRREALQMRFPFWPRLDARDRSALENPVGLQVFLLRSVLDAVRFHEEYLGESAQEKNPKAREILAKTLGEVQVTLQGWANVWRDRDLSEIEGELGRWHPEEARQRLLLFGRSIDALDEELEGVADDLDVYRRDLRDLEARERAELANWLGLDPERRREMSADELQTWFQDARRRARDAGADGALRAWKDISVQVAKREAAIEEKESEQQLLERVIERMRRLQRSMSLARRGFLAWLSYAENQAQETLPIHRRAFVADVHRALDALRSRQTLDADLAKFVAEATRDFQLLLALDTYVGGPAKIVSGVAAAMRELGMETVSGKAEGEPLLRGPGSLTDGLNHAYLLWPNPIQLDADKVDVRDGDAQVERRKGLLATVIARAASSALYAREPNPLGAMEVIQRAQGASAFEIAMLREAASPQKTNDELPGGLPLVVAVEGTFPEFGREIRRRPIVDTLRQLTAPLFLGGPIPFEGDAEASPEYDVEKGWQREGLSAWSLADFAETVRKVRDDAQKDAESAEATSQTGAKTGRMLVVGNLGFAMDSVSGGGGQGGNIEIGLLYHEASSPGINGVPLLRRIFEWALRGNRFEEFDRRQTVQPRKLTNFRNELLRQSLPVRAANVYKAALTNAASATPFLEDAAQDDGANAGFGLGAVREDPVKKALGRLIDGVDTELEEREGLDKVIKSYEEKISRDADAREKRYETWGALFAPVLLLVLLLGSLLFTWARYR